MLIGKVMLIGFFIIIDLSRVRLHSEDHLLVGYAVVRGKEGHSRKLNLWLCSACPQLIEPDAQLLQKDDFELL